MKKIIYTITLNDKDIVDKNTDKVLDFIYGIDSLKPDDILKYEDSVDLIINGFDYVEQQLFEIPEFKEYMRYIMSEAPQAFVYFSSNIKKYIYACYCDIITTQKIDENTSNIEYFPQKEALLMIQRAASSVTNNSIVKSSLKDKWFKLLKS